ncbi:MAG: DUF1232 domain-containing protein [Proteobacteria bacterium]|nr:DUF1232 domain-containing protein [Pseudomonadota bacterium]NOG59648.1 DUF1232 domain-containing protein [Pseudomonadota bacterium]
MTEKIVLLFSAMHDRRTPWYAKAMTVLVLAYIVCPIDFIPDFIPVIGLLDEMILVPVALAIIFKFIPESVKQDKLLNEIDQASKKKLIYTGILVVISLWVMLSLILYFYLSNQELMF